LPNWCFNRLKIIDDGSKEAVEQAKEFVEKAKRSEDDTHIKTDLSMDNFIPCPKELNETMSGSKGKGTPAQKELENKQASNVEKFGYPTWYEWRLSNWGCKWDVDAVLENNDISDDYVYVEYVFDSPWSPPINFLQKVSEIYPNLKFVLKYEEEGMGFLGVAKAVNGDVDDQCIEY